MLRRWYCSLFGHDLRKQDTEIGRGFVLRTKCRRCDFVIQTPQQYDGE